MKLKKLIKYLSPNVMYNIYIDGMYVDRIKLQNLMTEYGDRKIEHLSCGIAYDFYDTRDIKAVMWIELK